MNFLPSRLIVSIGLATIVCLAASYILSSRSSSVSKPDALSQVSAGMTPTFAEAPPEMTEVQDEEAPIVTTVPSHDVALDIHGALAAFEDALAQSGDDLPQADRDQVDRLMTNLRLQAATEASAN